MTLNCIRSFFITLCVSSVCLTAPCLSAAGTDASAFEVTCAPELLAAISEGLTKPEEAGVFQTENDYFARIHPDAIYHLKAYSDNGDIVQLFDGSKWSVHPFHRKTVLYWVQADDLFIKPKSSCFSSYKYVLHNRTTNQAVEVNLNQPPLPTGEQTFWIVNIDAGHRWVQLNDNTIWQINAYDVHFPKWMIGHRLLVGVNNKWRTAAFPHILINVDVYSDPYSEAEFYGYPATY